MDSKLKRFCILCSFSVMVLVVLLVIYINQEEAQRTANNSIAAQPTPQVTFSAVISEAEGVRTDKGLQIGYALSAFEQDESFFDEEPKPEEVPPQNTVKVDVKDKVEYVASPDIALLMKTEADIDPEEEDISLRDALEDADKSEIKKLQKTTANSSVGIDVSKRNKDIDWDKVKAAGVDFAIIRAGYRGSQTGALVEDLYFRQNMRGAANANIKTGVYFFTQATNEAEAVEEASMVVQLLQEYDIQYPVFIDTGGTGGNGRADALDRETRTGVCEAFCQTIENEGYQAGVYASCNWYNNCIEAKRLEKYFIWLAEYREEPLYQGEYQVWQYTSEGSIDGIEGNVDMNVSYLK